MKEEYVRSLEKWDISLSDAEEKTIFENSLKQVISRVNVLTRNEWDMNSGLIVVTVANGPKRTIEIPSEESDDSDIHIVRVRGGWKVDTEQSEESILIKDFPEFLEKTITSWSRTAIFYGTGSYKVH